MFEDHVLIPVAGIFLKLSVYFSIQAEQQAKEAKTMKACHQFLFFFYYLSVFVHVIFSYF